MEAKDYIQIIAILITFIVAIVNLFYNINMGKRARISNVVLSKRAERVDNVLKSFSHIAAHAHPLAIQNKTESYPIELIRYFEIINMTLQDCSYKSDDIEIKIKLKYLVKNAIEYAVSDKQNENINDAYSSQYFSEIEALERLLNKWVTIQWWWTQKEAIRGKKLNPAEVDQLFLNYAEGVSKAKTKYDERTDVH